MMDNLETVGQTVLLTYGQFLDNLTCKLSQLKESLPAPLESINDPIDVEIGCEEQESFLDLVVTDNKIQRKILIVFCTLCKEVKLLENEAKSKYIQRLLFYGEGSSEYSEQEARQMASEIFPLLLDMQGFIARCRNVLSHIVNQLTSAYSFSWKGLTDTNCSMFQEVFATIGDLLVILIAFDSCIVGNSVLEEHFLLLKQFVIVSSKNVSTQCDMHLLISTMKQIHTEYFTGQIFHHTISFGMNTKVPTGNSVLSNHLNAYLKNQIQELENKREFDSMSYKRFSSIIASYVFSTVVFGATDKRLNRQAADFAKKCAAVPLYGEVLWFPGELLAKNLPNRKGTQAKFKVPEPSLVDHGGKIQKEVRNFSFQVYKWTLLMENSVAQDTTFVKLHETNILNLCIEGIEMAFQIKFLVNYFSTMHSLSGRPMTKSSALGLCKLIELLKGIESIFMRHKMFISKCLNHAIQRVLVQILSFILKEKNDLMREKSYSEVHVDTISSLLLAERILFGACSEDKIILSKLALTLTNHVHLMQDSAFPVSKHFQTLILVSSLQERLMEATSCHFIFSGSHLFATYLKHLMESHGNLERVQYVLNSWADNHTLLDSNAKPLRDKLFGETKEEIQSKVLQEICQNVETNLRLQAHSYLNSESVLSTTKDYRAYLRVPVMCAFKRTLSVRSHLEEYLDRTFYDLTTIALHDWHTYKRMRSFGNTKLSLMTIEDNLPSQILSQGLDVIEVLRNIDLFVSTYVYNMNNQCFIESASNSKHLNSLSINQIANSIWTHGIGIMNTTANFIYQFLRKKLVIFSQFLFNDNIKSRLLKDQQFFNENKAGIPYYPYERAEKFSKGIMRLGVTDEGLSYIDQYRILVSHIGNALGFIRMVRAGGLHHCLGAASFLPELETVELPTTYEDQSLSCALSSFRDVMTNLIHNLNEGTEYFKLLVDVFSNVFTSPENSHVKLFIMSIPPLTINYIQHMVSAKEKMTKRNRDGSLFTDDGFPMGLAYLLSVLDLTNEFSSLHWFISVKEKYNEEEKTIYETPNENKESNTLKLAAKRLQMFAKEFKLLEYNINSAKVFFSESGTI